MVSSNSEEIINRLKEVLGAKSDGQLAAYLGISRQNIGAARKREDVPTVWIYKVAELSGCSMDWLSFGQGPKRRVGFATEGSQFGGQVASPQSPYGSHGVTDSGSGGDLQQDPAGFGFGTAVEMLAKIYSTGDSLLIDAVNANIKAICEAIESRRREQRSTTELEDLKKRLLALEKKLVQE